MMIFDGVEISFLAFSVAPFVVLEFKQYEKVSSTYPLFGYQIDTF